MCPSHHSTQHLASYKRKSKSPCEQLASFVAPTGIEPVFVKKQGVRGMCPSHHSTQHLASYKRKSMSPSEQLASFVAPTGIEPVFVKKTRCERHVS